MRNIIFLMFVCCISCKANKVINEKLPVTNNDSIYITLNNDSIIGEWEILTTVSVSTVKMKGGRSQETTTETICNSCPRIRFNKDRDGIIIYPQGDKSVFNWTINENKLQLSFNHKNQKHILFGKIRKFKFKLYYKSNNYHLELMVPKMKLKYILLR